MELQGLHTYAAVHPFISSSYFSQHTATVAHERRVFKKISEKERPDWTRGLRRLMVSLAPTAVGARKGSLFHLDTEAMSRGTVWCSTAFPALSCIEPAATGSPDVMVEEVFVPAAFGRLLGPEVPRGPTAATRCNEATSIPS
jgi:hypothetical protein